MIGIGKLLCGFTVLQQVAPAASRRTQCGTGGNKNAPSKKRRSRAKPGGPGELVFPHYSAFIPSRSLERDVVVHLLEIPAALLGRRSPAAARCAGRGGLARLARHWLRSAALAPPEHPHLARDDFGGVALLPFLILPLAGAERAFDVDLAPLLEVLAGNFGEAPEERHAM